MRSRDRVWQSGKLLADRYQIKECLRSSVTCGLYRADDIFRGVTKLVLGPGPAAATEQAGLEWFASYCKKLLSVPDHPNVLTPVRMDRHGGRPFVVLADECATFWDAAIKDGSLTRELGPMISTALQSARGLAWLHQHDYLHYNMKPQNVLLNGNGVAKVWKFGQERAKTPVYASPEQLSDGEELTPATDMWSWAVSVLHMFVGCVTWDAGPKAPAILQRYMHGGPARESVPLMPADLTRLLGRCLHKEPADRPASMEEVVQEVQALMDELGEDEEQTVASALAHPPAAGDQTTQWDTEPLEVLELAEEEAAEQPPPEQEPAGSDQGEEPDEEGDSSQSQTRRWHFRRT